MGDGSLSQDEIDALLKGADEVATPSNAPSMDMPQTGAGLSPVERDSLADLVNSSMGTVVHSLTALLGKNVSISNAYVEVKSESAIRGDFGRQYVQVGMDFTGGLNGKNLIVFNLGDAGVISSLMMGDDSGSAPMDLSEAHLSTIQEFVNQMLSSCATQFSDKIGRGIGTTPPDVSVANSAGELRMPGSGELAKITYNISIESMVNSKFYHILELPLASDLARSTMGSGSGMQQQQYQQVPQQHVQQQMQPQVGISPVKFPPLGEGLPPGVGPNINLLLDVKLALTVELGRTTMLVKDILGLGEGSIIELDKLAGEPVDLLVNGKLIARGEVVVIDENFGVRVTDIVSPAERLMRVQ
ncbi:MAG TPA: flagellar motor switch protein FliN [Spirochaetota bacterium]|nr:flagellar motor switch protein FliN [Spirochaetota bacterium]